VEAHILIAVATAIITALLSVLAWFARTNYTSLEARVEATEGKIHDFRLHIAEQYATKGSLDRIMDTLERIESLLHTKADK